MHSVNSCSAWKSFLGLVIEVAWWSQASVVISLSRPPTPYLGPPHHSSPGDPHRLCSKSAHPPFLLVVSASLSLFSIFFSPLAHTLCWQSKTLTGSFCLQRFPALLKKCDNEIGCMKRVQMRWTRKYFWLFELNGHHWKPSVKKPFYVAAKSTINFRTFDCTGKVYQRETKSPREPN